MKSADPVTPTEEKTIIFYDDELTAVQLEGGEIFVPVRRLCENLGLTWPPQWQRIQRDEVLSEAAKGIIITITPSPGGRGGGPQETICLPLDLVPGWLFGIQTGRVKESIRPKLIRYRRECFRVLWDAFKGDVLPAMAPGLESPPGDLTPAERALALAEAVYAMAKQQVTLERWLTFHDQRLEAVEDATLAAHERLDKAAAMVGDQARRLGSIELSLAGGATITDAQAAAVSEAVKALAYHLGQEKDKGNPYQRVYSELYRKFRVPGYRALPLESFPAVMDWLTEWWQQVTDEPAPFAAG